jgi:hypothetical protein
VKRAAPRETARGIEAGMLAIDSITEKIASGVETRLRQWLASIALGFEDAGTASGKSSVRCFLAVKLATEPSLLECDEIARPHDSSSLIISSR